MKTVRTLGSGTTKTISFPLVIALSMFTNWKKYSATSMTFKEYILSVKTTHDGRGGQGLHSGLLVTHKGSAVAVASLDAKYGNDRAFMMATDSYDFEWDDFAKGKESVTIMFDITVDKSTTPFDIFRFESEEQAKTAALVLDLMAMSAIEKIVSLLGPPSRMSAGKTPAGLLPLMTDALGDTDGDMPSLPAFLMDLKGPHRA